MRHYAIFAMLSALTLAACQNGSDENDGGEELTITCPDGEGFDEESEECRAFAAENNDENDGGEEPTCGAGQRACNGFCITDDFDCDGNPIAEDEPEQEPEPANDPCPPGFHLEDGSCEENPPIDCPEGFAPDLVDQIEVCVEIIEEEPECPEGFVCTPEGEDEPEPDPVEEPEQEPEDEPDPVEEEEPLPTFLIGYGILSDLDANDGFVLIAEPPSGGSRLFSLGADGTESFAPYLLPNVDLVLDLAPSANGYVVYAVVDGVDHLIALDPIGNITDLEPMEVLIHSLSGERVLFERPSADPESDDIEIVAATLGNDLAFQNETVLFTEAAGTRESLKLVETGTDTIVFTNVTTADNRLMLHLRYADGEMDAVQIAFGGAVAQKTLKTGTSEYTVLWTNGSSSFVSLVKNGIVTRVYDLPSGTSDMLAADNGVLLVDVGTNGNVTVFTLTDEGYTESEMIVTNDAMQADARLARAGNATLVVWCEGSASAPELHGLLLP